MKIGIACHAVYGGSSVVASELGLALARRNHEVHFISFSLPFRLESYQSHVYFHEVERMNYPLFDSDPYSLSIAVKMAEIAEYENLDILHVHYAIPFATCAFLAREMLAPRLLKIITTLHGTDINIVGNHKSFFGITRFSIKQSDAVTAVSESLKQQTYQNFDIGREIEVVYNFINPEHYRRDLSLNCRREFAPAGEKILIHISNFRPVKRVADVIRIFQQVQQKTAAKLLLVGDGPDRSNVQELVRTAGLTSEVHFLGKQNCVVGLLSISDVLLLASESESFGLTALEANACEVPVVATNVGGLPEVIIDGETGFLSDVNDIDKMSADTLRLLNDEDLRLRMGKAARQRAITVFNEEQMVSKYERIYQRLLG